MQSAIFRRIITFFLCFVFILSFVSFPARAVGLDWILRQVGTDIGTAAILEGLGISRDIGSTDNYYNDLITRIKNAMADAGVATLDYIDAYYSVSSAGPLFAFPLSLIAFVRNWVFDNGVVTDSYSGFANSQISAISGAIQNYEIAFAFSNPYCILFEIGNGDLSLGCSKYPFTLGSDGVYRCYSNGAPQSFKIYTVHSDHYYAHPDKVSVFDPSGKPVRLFRGSNPVTTYNPITLGTIAPPGTLFTSAYPQWLEHERTLVDGTTETLVQIGLGNTLEETEDLTQEQIWSGLGTIQIPEQDQNQGTLLDILQAVVQLPTQIIGSIQTALQSFFQFSGQASDYAIQLRDFFPFCIPFDLYDFITVLSAEPEAPAFHWEIPVPQLGQTFELEVDLSAWDDIAVLFRNFELLAFIFGLAIMTREKFLRS